MPLSRGGVCVTLQEWSVCRLDLFKAKVAELIVNSCVERFGVKSAFRLAFLKRPLFSFWIFPPIVGSVRDKVWPYAILYLDAFVLRVSPCFCCAYILQACLF